MESGPPLLRNALTKYTYFVWKPGKTRDVGSLGEINNILWNLQMAKLFRRKTKSPIVHIYLLQR